jgi:hypothetical protein
VTGLGFDPLSSPCPHCGVVLNCHVTPDGKDSNPLPGDATVCSVCNSILIFAADLSLRLPTEAEKRIIFRSFPEEISH